MHPGFIAGTPESLFEALRPERAELAEAGGLAPASAKSGHDLQLLSRPRNSHSGKPERPSHPYRRYNGVIENANTVEFMECSEISDYESICAVTMI